MCDSVISLTLVWEIEDEYTHFYQQVSNEDVGLNILRCLVSRCA